MSRKMQIREQDSPMAKSLSGSLLFCRNLRCIQPSNCIKEVQWWTHMSLMSDHFSSEERMREAAFDSKPHDCLWIGYWIVAESFQGSEIQVGKEKHTESYKIWWFGWLFLFKIKSCGQMVCGFQYPQAVDSVWSMHLMHVWGWLQVYVSFFLSFFSSFFLHMIWHDHCTICTYQCLNTMANVVFCRCPVDFLGCM